MTDVDRTSNERTGFEAWADNNGYGLRRKSAPFTNSADTNGDYTNASTQDAWEAWQARASLRDETSPRQKDQPYQIGYDTQALDEEDSAELQRVYNLVNYWFEEARKLELHVTRLRTALNLILAAAVTVGEDAGHTGIEKVAREALEGSPEEPSGKAPERGPVISVTQDSNGLCVEVDGVRYIPESEPPLYSRLPENGKGDV